MVMSENFVTRFFIGRMPLFEKKDLNISSCIVGMLFANKNYV
jgi:hypothetical protein